MDIIQPKTHRSILKPILHLGIRFPIYLIYWNPRASSHCRLLERRTHLLLCIFKRLVLDSPPDISIDYPPPLGSLSQSRPIKPSHAATRQSLMLLLFSAPHLNLSALHTPLHFADSAHGPYSADTLPDLEIRAISAMPRRIVLRPGYLGHRHWCAHSPPTRQPSQFSLTSRHPAADLNSHNLDNCQHRITSLGYAGRV